MLFGGAAAALIVIVVVIALIVKGCSGRTDALAGTWDFDGTTTYEFDGNGTGAMVCFPPYPTTLHIRLTAISS